MNQKIVIWIEREEEKMLQKMAGQSVSVPPGPWTDVNGSITLNISHQPHDQTSCNTETETFL